MTYHYEPGAVRWKRHNYKCDVRSCHPTKGWERTAELQTLHPITGKLLNKPEWWFRDVYKGDGA